MDEQTVAGLCAKLAATLGEQLQAVFLFGSAVTSYYHPQYSDVNVLIVARSPANVDTIRTSWSSLRSEWLRVCQTPPAVVPAGVFLKLVDLHPFLGRHLCSEARLLHGELPMPTAHGSEYELVANLASNAIRSSRALLAHGWARRSATADLHRVARQLTHNPLKETHSPDTLFTRVQLELQAAVDRLPRLNGLIQDAHGNVAASVQAIYQLQEGAVLVIPRLSGDLLHAFDWDQLALRINGRFERVCITTPAQLRLSIAYDNPLDQAIGRYRLIWGDNLINDLQVSPAQVQRSLARLGLSLLVFELSYRYLAAAGEDESHKVIHDLQNRLLNMRLQVELLRRLHGYHYPVPDQELPDRKEPIETRIVAIENWLEAWIADYCLASTPQHSK